MPSRVFALVLMISTHEETWKANLSPCYRSHICRFRFFNLFFFWEISAEVPSIDSDKYIDKIGSRKPHSSTIHLKGRKSYMVVI